ncbi:hypothetical protein Tdes44962_MAKER08366 [Teratosphaeria destructans]|uniref:F-box domain-containing protein n=1 Tax=Teratosphaeria destructans TaxID=418781 RepID=A0A9W7W4Q0_9PEZI|nr:hypothetical protein Tdes44962_MAKER08366 [Teratosphaeria destructans]
MPGDSSPCRFLALPPELRNTIYEYLLVYKYGITLSRRIIGVHCMPPLLRTCRQIKTEASAIYYSQNDFTAIIPSPSPGRDGAVWSWFEMLGAENCALIRCLHLRWLDLRACRQFAKEYATVARDEELAGDRPDVDRFVEEKMVPLAAGDFQALLDKGLQMTAFDFASDEWCGKGRISHYAQAWARAMKRRKERMMR